MAKAKVVKEANEVGPKLPPSLIGHMSQQKRLIDSFASGKPPHAWLLTGVKGIGKRTTAQLAATFVLNLPNKVETLTKDDFNPHTRLVENGSHPDFSMLQLATDPKAGKQKTEISVEQVRILKESMYKTPSMASNRVAIIDSVDEMNRNSANAVLKLLEEPPANAFIFLVCHNPGRLLPTIRSRCAQLSFQSLSEDEMMHWSYQQIALDQSGDSPTTYTDQDWANALKAANGRPGLALDLLKHDLMPLEAELQDYLTSGFGMEGAQAIAMKIAKSNRDAKTLMKSRLFDWLHQAARSSASKAVSSQNGPISKDTLVDWQDLWEKTDQRFKQAEALNLDERGLWTSVLLGLKQT